MRSSCMTLTFDIWTQVKVDAHQTDRQTDKQTDSALCGGGLWTNNTQILKQASLFVQDQKLT